MAEMFAEVRLGVISYKLWIGHEISREQQKNPPVITSNLESGLPFLGVSGLVIQT